MKNSCLLIIFLSLTANAYAKVVHTDILIKNTIDSNTIYATLNKIEMRYTIYSHQEKQICIETASKELSIKLSIPMDERKPQIFYQGTICSNATVTVSKNFGDLHVTIDSSRCN